MIHDFRYSSPFGLLRITTQRTERSHIIDYTHTVAIERLFRRTCRLYHFGPLCKFSSCLLHHSMLVCSLSPVVAYFVYAMLCPTFQCRFLSNAMF